MTSLQGAIKWSHEGEVFADKILIFILVKETVLYTGKSPIESPLILWDTKTVSYQLTF